MRTVILKRLDLIYWMLAMTQPMLSAHPDVKAFEHLKCLAQSELLKERLIEEEK
jgi:hypothetical protein